MLVNYHCVNDSVTYVIKDYIDLPMLPTNTTVVIKKIGIYNWDSWMRKPRDMIQYAMLTAVNPSEFPEGKNKDIDYIPTDNVSPVVVIDTDDKRYRVSYLLWFPLADVHDGTLLKQSLTRSKVFPKTIFIDDNNQWMCELLSLIGSKILNKLHTTSGSDVTVNKSSKTTKVVMK